MILAADFGGTTIKLGLVREGQVLSRSRLEARANHPFLNCLEMVAVGWEFLLKENGLSLADCTGAGLALPFLVDPKGQRVQGEFGKFPGATEVDFSAWSRARLGLSAVLENDLRVALLGEWAAGAAQGKNDVVMLAFGTGIGCAVLSEGRLLRGAHNRAASLTGHSTIAYEKSTARCGNVGCAEDLASTATLAQLAEAQPGYRGSKLSSASKIDYELIFALAAEGDDCAQSLRRQSLRVWSVLVQNAVIAYDPEMVMLGGGVLRSHEVILPAIRQHLCRHMPGFPLEIPIVASTLGDDAALLGCATLAGQTFPAFTL
jgi:glucokinase